MRNRLSTLALAAVLAAGASGIAVAQTCPPGYVLQGAYCQPTPTPGGVVGGAANAAGAIVGGAVDTAGAIAGGAVNTAGAIAGGTVGAVTGQPPAPPPPAASGGSTPPAASGSSTPPPQQANTCPTGMMLYLGSCFPAH